MTYVRAFTIASLLSFFTTFNVAFAERSIRGVYTVPVGEQDQDLEGMNSYPVRYKSTNYNNPSDMKFFLPKQLVGSDILVDAHYDAQTDSWTGELVDYASCNKVGRYQICNITFKKEGLPIDLSQVDQHLSQSNLNSEQIAAKKRVAALFSNEPIGIVKYRLRGRDRK